MMGLLTETLYHHEPGRQSVIVIAFSPHSGCGVGHNIVEESCGVAVADRATGVLR
jgi:hypothetical protein